MLMIPMLMCSTPSTHTAEAKSKLVCVGKYRVTYYCPKCNGGYSTASGKRAKAKRTIAVDRRKHKFGTKLKINGRWYTAEDTGGAIKGNRIDIFVAKHSLERGVKYFKVYKRRK